ncbi:hypothetical protein STEG23_005012 [Scotinomys teguina]
MPTPLFVSRLQNLQKSNMKILVAVAVFFLVSTQLFAEEIGVNDDLNYWSDWSDSDQIKEALPEPFEHLLQRIARRPKPQQFFGLMGKRDAGHGQISHKMRFRCSPLSSPRYLASLGLWITAWLSFTANITYTHSDRYKMDSQSHFDLHFLDG